MLDKATLYTTNRPFVDVKDHGAVGDGVTDDTKALQLAIAAARSSGKDIFFSNGTYSISKQLRFDGMKNANVYAKDATIRLADNYKYTGFEGALEFDNTHNLKVFGFTVDGNESAFPSSATFMHAFRFKGSSNIEWAYNTTTNTVGNGVQFSDSDNPVVHHNTVSGWQHGGIEFKRSANLYAGYNTITGVGDKGLTRDIRQNHETLATSGILITGTATGGDKSTEAPHSGAIVERNIIRNVPGGGIKIEDQNKVQVLYNEVHTFGKDGIKVHPINQKANPLEYVTDAVVKGNVVSGFENWRGDGSGYIVLHSVRGAEVTDNLILGNEGREPSVIPKWKYEYGIRVNPFLGWGEQPENITITNNRIYGTREPIALQESASSVKQHDNVIADKVPANAAKPDGDSTTPVVASLPDSPVDVPEASAEHKSSADAQQNETKEPFAEPQNVLEGETRKRPVTTIALSAAADLLEGKGARFMVLLDGKQIGNTQETTANHGAGEEQHYVFKTHEPVVAGKLSVVFINDAYKGPGADLNLWVKRVAVDGQELDISDARYTLAGKDNDIGSRSKLHGNGSLDFALPAATPQSADSSDKEDAAPPPIDTAAKEKLLDTIADSSDEAAKLVEEASKQEAQKEPVVPDAAKPQEAAPADTAPVAEDGSNEIVLTVAADHYKGAPTVLVMLDGKALGDAVAITALENNGETQRIRLTTDTDIASVAALQVRMTNDAYGGSKDKDRNIYVHDVSINGQSLNGEKAIYHHFNKPELTYSIYRKGRNFLSGSGVLSYELPVIPAPLEGEAIKGDAGGNTIRFISGNEAILLKDAVSSTDLLRLGSGEKPETADVQQLVSAMSGFADGQPKDQDAMTALPMDIFEQVLAAPWK